MSALEVIERIKALPPKEKALVVEFVHQLDTQPSGSRKEVRFATDEEAKAAGDKVLKQHSEVFRKLAQ